MFEVTIIPLTCSVSNLALSQKKLLRVERTIVTYRLTDNASLKQISLDSFEFDQQVQIVPLKEDDPLLYNGYELTPYQVEQFNLILPAPIFPNFGLFFYVLECTGIYE